MKWSILTVLGLMVLGGSLWAAEPEVVFEDAFKGKPAEGWTWLRENPKAWRINEGNRSRVGHTRGWKKRQREYPRAFCGPDDYLL